MYASVPNKLAVLFLKVKVMLVLILNSYIVPFGELIAFHLIVVHIIFSVLWMMLVEPYGFI